MLSGVGSMGLKEAEVWRAIDRIFIMSQALTKPLKRPLGKVLVLSMGFVFRLQALFLPMSRRRVSVAPDHVSSAFSTLSLIGLSCNSCST
jgi:hypothetical protein